MNPCLGSLAKGGVKRCLGDGIKNRAQFLKVFPTSPLCDEVTEGSEVIAVQIDLITSSMHCTLLFSLLISSTITIKQV